MLSSFRNLILVSTLVVTTTACQKARMTHTQAAPAPVVTQTPTVEPVPPQGPPIVTVPLDPKQPQRPPQVPAPTPAPAPQPQRPEATTVPYTDINNRPEARTIYDCHNDCAVQTAPAPAPALAPAPAPAPAPQPEPTPAPPVVTAPVEEAPAAPAPTYQEVCYAPSNWIQPQPQQVDIIVVADSAGPNFDRTDLTAKAIAAYVKKQVQRDRHVRIGMIPAHGSRSALSGRLFQPIPHEVSTNVEDLAVDDASDSAREYMRNGNPETHGTDPSNPYVLDSLSLEFTDDNLLWFARTNLEFMPQDPMSDGGQSGLYSLYKALTTNFQELKNLGLFRSGATQHILLLSNEADICAANLADPTPERANKAMDSEMKDKTPEQAARERDCASFGQEDLIGRIQELQRDYALTVSAIVPTDRNNFKSLHPFNSEETEVGSGYIEVAEQTGGHLYDLFDLEISEAGLSRLATTLEEQFETGLSRRILSSQFRLEYEGNLTSVTPIVMDPIYDEVLLSRNLPEACLTLSEYDARCPNMSVVAYSLSAETVVGNSRNSSVVTLQDPGKFGSKVQINFCSSVLR